MHPNPAFRNETQSRNIAFIRERGFGSLIANGPERPLIANIPALLTEDGKELEFHLVRSNPITSLLDTPQGIVFLVNGPDGYISPDWYEIDDQVPTWNYVAAKIEGICHKLAPNSLPPLLDRLSAHFEKRLLPKKPWTREKMSSDIFDSMAKTIIPYKVDVKKIDATWKLNQNKPDQVRINAANQVKLHGVGLSTNVLSDHMKKNKMN